MSFSSKVKGELSLHFGNGRHCEIAEIAAYVNIYGQIAVFGGNFCLKIQTENDYAVKKCFTLLRNTFNMIADVSVRISGQKRQTKVYTLLVRDAAAILQATGILTIEKEQKKLKKRIYPPVVSSICCRRAYIRGAFISVGSVNDPEKNYHLEFVLADLSAAEQLREEFPQRKLQIVDSLSSSLGQGLLVLRAFDLRERGMCLEDTARTLLSLRHRIAHLFTVDDLMYLSRGGRLSGAKAMLGTALGLKPLLKGDPNGRIVLCGKARGRAQAIGKLADQYNALVRYPGDQTVCIAHGNAPQEAEALAQRLRQTNPPKEILIAPFDPANGCHAGPGALALFFEGDETVRLHP